MGREAESSVGDSLRSNRSVRSAIRNVDLVMPRLKRWIMPMILIFGVILIGLWFWWPPPESPTPDRNSDLGAALIGGAIVAIAALYLQWQVSIELSRYQSINDQYIALWKQLQKPRQAADDLWRKATSANLERFAQELEDTRHAVEDSRSLLELRHYEQLLAILAAFDEFRNGKQELLSAREAATEFRQGRWRRDIESHIRKNRSYKDKYEELLDDIGRVMNTKLG